ncbi:hypothetical protein NBG4_670017 [Candidatus Sulfobium mesophilum]|uniref:Uncharacterized protein n=1 Tax=Candidatus Sulfobium mesophilum TaxID=2016548 RepID=A0A2U3QJX9_9BACT|nr:hypothetical protein NBG4_670017 [Candidatus Sulfobium mesophilum]
MFKTSLGVAVVEDLHPLPVISKTNAAMTINEYCFFNLCFLSVLVILFYFETIFQALFAGGPKPSRKGVVLSATWNYFLLVNDADIVWFLVTLLNV